MASTPEDPRHPADLLAEMRRLRESTSRSEAAQALKRMAAAFSAEPESLLSVAGGADHARAEAAKAIAALAAAYERPDAVMDALWARAVNLTHAWASASD